MNTLVTVLHVAVCFILIVVILLQAGKGGMGAALGGGGAGSVFGGRGASTFLTKITGACAAIFMITSLTLSFFATRATSVVRSDGAAPASSQQQAPPASPLTAPGQGAPGAPAQTPPSAPAPAPAQEAAPAAPAQQQGK